MKKKRVMVLMGGVSAEHWVSMRSGREVLRHLDHRKYEVVPVAIAFESTGMAVVDEVDLLATDPDKKKLSKISSLKCQPITADMMKEYGGVVFIVLHGRFGEDGRVQGMLEFAGVPYVGSGVLASALGMDKMQFRKLMRAEGIAIPQYVVVDEKFRVSDIEKKLDYPMFVKPNAQGSSVGAGIAKNKKELINQITEALKFDTTVLVDEYIVGREFTCAVLGNKDCRALPVVEIKPLKGEFFDYASKYTESGSEEICPAQISQRLTKEIQKLAIKVYKTLGCRGFGRVDFLLKNGRPVVLEINTLPGLTPASLFPKSAKAAGISYSELLDKLIKYAYDKN